MAYGINRMLWCFIKKVVIADRLAIFVNFVYNNPSNHKGITLVIATVFFSFQIYCDFSGYSDIAIGAAKIMGFDLMENFKKPYFSKSISEFWNRWHISLSSWFRDYVYISLGGNRVKLSRHHINLFITFLVSGLWHGANWTFVFWGGLHGLYLMVGIILKPLNTGIKNRIGIKKHPLILKFFQVITTFSLVTFSWIFFRANSMKDAFYISGNLFSDIGQWTNVSYIVKSISSCGLTKWEFIFSLMSICILELGHLLDRDNRLIDKLNEAPLVLRWSSYYLLIITILVMGVSGDASEFIYFQF